MSMFKVKLFINVEVTKIHHLGLLLRESIWWTATVPAFWIHQHILAEDACPTHSSQPITLRATRPYLGMKILYHETLDQIYMQMFRQNLPRTTLQYETLCLSSLLPFPQTAVHSCSSLTLSECLLYYFFLSHVFPQYITFTFPPILVSVFRWSELTRIFWGHMSNTICTQYHALPSKDD